MVRLQTGVAPLPESIQRRLDPVADLRRALRSLWPILLIAAGCSSGKSVGQLENKTELVVLTRNAPTTYYHDRDGQLMGLEYELASRFARHLNLRVRFELFDSLEEILNAVAMGQGDLAAAGLTKTKSRSQQFLLGPEYQTIRELVVCNPAAEVSKPEDLIGKRLRTIARSSHEGTLSRLQQRIPELQWTTTSDAWTEQLLLEAWEGEIDCTVADSNIVAVDRRYLPELQTPFAIGEEESLVWLISENSAYLLAPLNEWFAGFRRSGKLQALLDKYFGHLEDFDYYDTAVFLRRVAQRLPRYRQVFVQASEETGLPWTLLAAVAYQESHWNPAAVSPTGVRGLMMLTSDTAGDLGVENRLDPEQSILGGARYLQQLMQRIPPFIEQPDRIWMALAAYNVGFNHLQDARRLAVELGVNPNTWPGVEEALPFLSRRRYYENLRYGYARGHEPVVFVRRIRNYEDLLDQVVELARAANPELFQPFGRP